MYCPRCGQQQISEEIKFCSRCGFPLALTAEVVAHGGSLPQLASLSGEKKWLTRGNGLKFSLAWFLFGTFLLTPIAAVSGADELVPLFGVIGFMGGILMLIFSFLFLPKGNKSFVQQPSVAADFNAAQNLSGNRVGAALPPQMSQPVSSYDPPPAGSWKAPETSEFAKPHSVTEGTTKLLQKDE